MLGPGVVVDRYRVLDLIGAGAMGEVFLAIDDALDRKVALKILAEAHRDNPELRARFTREAKAVAAVQHPNVVQVFTTGEFDGRPYLAMEYLRGRDLGTMVREDGSLGSPAAAAAVLDAARGRGAAARAGLMHRDVKPSNLVMLDDGTVKVTDFGLAKPQQPGVDPALTALGVVVGTPDYIAPEQARGETIDARVDVYSLGCTLFYVLTGRPPFRHGSDDDDKYLKVVARHLREPAPDPRHEAPGADDELAELTLAMMRKSPGERPTYPELIERLEAIRRRLRRGTTVRPELGPETPSMQLPIRPRMPRWLWATTALAVAIFLAGAVMMLWRAQAALTAPAGPPDAPPPPVAAIVSPDAAPPPAPPEPPAGMLFVTNPGGRRFFVDRFPVTQAEYGAVVPSYRFSARDAGRPVVGVPFDDARSFAEAAGKRLLRADEWQPALDTPGFVPAGMRLWEWVDDGDEARPDRAVRGVNARAGRRLAEGDKTVTFRLAEDVPGT